MFLSQRSVLLNVVFFLALSADGQAHGVLMWNSTAMDVVLHPEWVRFRLTGLILDQSILLGGSTT
jgi:hypothetical protein